MEMQVLRPRALPRGGTIGVCSPAGPVEEPCLAWGVEWLRGEGFDVACAPHALSRHGYLAGRDADRGGDFLALLHDPGIHAIMYIRGGYGTMRWLPGLDPAELRAARKLLIGHSDATSLALFAYARAGLGSLHGPMLNRSDLTREARERLFALACGEPAALEPLAGRPLAPGTATAPLVGGNLSLCTASLGTPWEIQTRDCILLLEDVAEQPYAIDRQLCQLRAAGKLEALAGVALGQFVHCESTRYPETSAQDVLLELLRDGFAGPIVWDLPVGHVADNRAVPIGVPVRLDGDAGTLTLLEPAVERT